MATRLFLFAACAALFSACAADEPRTPKMPAQGSFSAPLALIKQVRCSVCSSAVHLQNFNVPSPISFLRVRQKVIKLECARFRVIPDSQSFEHRSRELPVFAAGLFGLVCVLAPLRRYVPSLL